LPRSLVFAIGQLGLGLIRSPWSVFVVLLLYGGFAACTDGVGKAWISTLLRATTGKAARRASTRAPPAPRSWSRVCGPGSPGAPAGTFRY
jgi:hypothetical protein